MAFDEDLILLSSTDIWNEKASGTNKAVPKMLGSEGRSAEENIPWLVNSDLILEVN